MLCIIVSYCVQEYDWYKISTGTGVCNWNLRSEVNQIPLLDQPNKTGVKRKELWVDYVV